MSHCSANMRNGLKMKFMRAVLFLCCVGLCFIACKKSNISPGLFGKWELRRSYGGFAGFDSTYKAGNGNVYQFNSDSTYKRFANGKLSDQGTFHITHIRNPSANYNTEIYFNNTQYGDQFTFNGSTKFTIGTVADDGVASDYQKISN